MVENAWRAPAPCITSRPIADLSARADRHHPAPIWRRFARRSPISSITPSSIPAGCARDGRDRRRRRQVRRGAGARSGAGHPQDRAETNLQALSTAFPARATRVKGTGLGLTSFAPWPNGTAAGPGRKARAPGTGSTFILQLPIREMSRILVVEDEQHLADGLRFNLEAEGYQVEVVDTGEAALELLSRRRRRRRRSTSWCWTSCCPARTASPSCPKCGRPASSFPP